MLSKFQVKFVKSLHQKKARNSTHQFIVEGEKNINELLQSKLSVNFIFALPEWLNNNSAKIEKRVEIIEVNEKELLLISTQITPNKVLAVVEMPKYTLSHFDTDTVIGLENVQDPGNLGTIIRIADWYGIKNIICSEDTVDVYNPKVINSTMGSFCRVQVHYTDLKDYIRLSQKLVYGMVLDGFSIYATLFDANAMILLGNESQGLSEGALHFVTHPITIPRIGKAESLNVAVSAAIACDNFLGRRL
ncbi:MAG: RNA methyltransferase [Bacteroidetes bacterium]|nr:RNA methyltransferase [Bacteroidota bacterium]